MPRSNCTTRVGRRPTDITSCCARTAVFRSIKKPGFTLMEVLIAMVVLAIALTGFFSLFSQTVAVEEAARFNTVAPMLAQKAMAEAVAGRAGAGGDFPDHPGYAWDLSITDVAPGVLGGDAVQGLKQMDVKVSFNNGERTYSLRAYDWLDLR